MQSHRSLTTIKLRQFLHLDLYLVYYLCSLQHLVKLTEVKLLHSRQVLLPCLGYPWEASSFLDEDWRFPVTAWYSIWGQNRLFPFGCKVLYFFYSGPDFALLIPWEFITPWLKQQQPQWPSLLQVTVPVIISISFIFRDFIKFRHQGWEAQW